MFWAGSLVSEQGVVFGSTLVVRRFDQGTTIIATPKATGGIPTAPFESNFYLSGDGRFLVFIAPDGEFLPSANPALHVLVRDLWTGTYERASEGPNGELPGWVKEAAISADGNLVAFPAVTDLLPLDNNGDYDLYVRDRQAGSLEIVTLSPLGQPAAYPPFPLQQIPRVMEIDLSADGRFVSFASLASNLVAGDNPGTWDVFCRDRLTGVTECINLDFTGLPSAYGSMDVAMSGDGRFVAFADGSPIMLPWFISTTDHVYIRDRATQQTELISIGVGGVPGNGPSRRVTVSQDGRFVAFLSDAANLVVGDTNGTQDLFLRDRLLGVTTRPLMKSDGTGPVAPATASYLGMSGDGKRIAFISAEAGVVPGDINGGGDVFVRDLAVAAAPMASYCVAKPFSGGCVAALSVTGIPDTSGATAFQISATGLFGSTTGLNSSRMSALAWSFGAPPPPYSPGSLCVAAPVHLLPRRLTGFLVGSCGGWYAETISPALMASLGWTPGTTVYTQLYVREPAASTYALSQGVSFVVR